MELYVPVQSIDDESVVLWEAIQFWFRVHEGRDFEAKSSYHGDELLP